MSHIDVDEEAGRIFAVELEGYLSSSFISREFRTGARIIVAGTPYNLNQGDECLVRTDLHPRRNLHDPFGNFISRDVSQAVMEFGPGDYFLVGVIGGSEFVPKFKSLERTFNMRDVESCLYFNGESNETSLFNRRGEDSKNMLEGQIISTNAKENKSINMVLTSHNQYVQAVMDALRGEGYRGVMMDRIDQV